MMFVPTPTPSPSPTSEAVVTAAAETDPLVVAIVSVLLTLLVGWIVNRLTAQWTKRNEHEKWLREQRLEVYAEAQKSSAQLRQARKNFTKAGTDLDEIRARLDAEEKVSTGELKEIQARLERTGSMQRRVTDDHALINARMMLIGSKAARDANRELSKNRHGEPEVYRQKLKDFVNVARKDLGTPD